MVNLDSRLFLLVDRVSGGIKDNSYIKSEMCQFLGENIFYYPRGM